MSQETSIVVEPSIAEQLPAKPAATPAQTPPADDVPEKYRGKSVKEIAEMHANAEAQLGRMGQEVGVWRGLVSDLTEKTRQAHVETPKAAPKITSDALLSDPTGAISQVIRHELEEALKPIKQARVTDQLESDLAALNRDFPHMRQTGDSPEFQKWSLSAPGRAADAAAVAKGDTTAARRLLEAWEDRKALMEGQGKTTTDAGKPQGTDGARTVATEAGGGGRQAQTGKILNRAEIVQLIIDKPEVYASDAYQAELLQAAKEGRIR